MEPERLYTTEEINRLPAFHWAMLLLYAVCPDIDARYYIGILLGLDSDELREQMSEAFLAHCLDYDTQALPTLGNEWADEMLPVMLEAFDEAMRNRMDGCAELVRGMAVQRLLSENLYR